MKAAWYIMHFPYDKNPQDNRNGDYHLTNIIFDAKSLLKTQKVQFQSVVAADAKSAFDRNSALSLFS